MEEVVSQHHAGMLEQLLLLKDVNHCIPLIDENKRYRYHLP
jgi:hypothetical protein